MKKVEGRVAKRVRERVATRAAEKPKAAPRPAGCTRYMQRRVAEKLPDILGQLLEKSKKDAGTLKALWQMSKLDGQAPATKKRKGSLAREMLREQPRE